MDVTILSSHSAEDGRIQINYSTFICVSVYAPNNEGAKINFIDNLKNFVSYYANTTDNIIIDGDFISCLNKNDRYPPIDRVSKSTDTLNFYLQQLTLKDCWQVCNPNINGFYFDKKSKTYSRLDYFLVSEKSVKSICVTQPVKNPDVIDHNAIKLVVEYQNSKTGPGYWKLNNQILEDSVFVDNINNIIENVTQDFATLKSHQLVWELLKIRIKEFSMHYFVLVKRIRNSLITSTKKFNFLRPNVIII